MSEQRGYLLDTNVISELRHPLRRKNVEQLIRKQPAHTLYLSVLTVGELQRGLSKLKRKEGVRSAKLAWWIDDIISSFGDRILPVDLRISTTWAGISAARTLPAIDALLAATAIVHGLTLVTRNTRDVEDTGASLLNPWLP